MIFLSVSSVMSVSIVLGFSYRVYSSGLRFLGVLSVSDAVYAIGNKYSRISHNFVHFTTSLYLVLSTSYSLRRLEHHRRHKRHRRLRYLGSSIFMIFLSVLNVMSVSDALNVPRHLYSSNYFTYFIFRALGDLGVSYPWASLKLLGFCPLGLLEPFNLSI